MSSIKKLTRKVIPKSTINKLERTYRIQKAKTAYKIYGKPSEGAKVIAVTGTNGKTTTCAFINEAIKASGLKTAVYTTAFTEICGNYSANTSHMTVASPWSVQKFFKKAKKAGANWIILEVTSHALDQYRILNVPIEVAVITNLTQDHLDYHITMDNYAQAKAKIITEFKPKQVVLNADDDWYEFFGRKVKGKFNSVGQGNATHQIKKLKLAAKSTKYTLISKLGSLNINLKIVGEFNAYNSAMAVAACQLIGINNKKIEQGLNNVKVVAGRLESVDVGQKFTVLVDYAHTPDALKNVLKAMRATNPKKLRLVFGATGDRDKTKRPQMGNIAAKYADFIYLTDDETYTEDGEEIRKAVLDGIYDAGGSEKYYEIADRKQAIKQALKDAGAGDVVLLTGIGHQNYRAMGGNKEPWDERQVVRDLLVGK